MRIGVFLLAWALAAGGVVEDARRALEGQNRAALETLAAQARAAAEREPQSARRQYEAALVHSYWAEVLAELRETKASGEAALAGIPAAERAVQLDPGSAEHHRILGTLYGQVIPGNLALALRYGRKTLAELDQAVTLDPKSSNVYLSRGIGKYYLPPAFGGGAEAALADLRRAVELDPENDTAHLWLGLALRKLNRNGEAREALARAVKLNPRRVWARQQLDKTPVR